MWPFDEPLEEWFRDVERSRANPDRERDEPFDESNAIINEDPRVAELLKR